MSSIKYHVGGREVSQDEFIRSMQDKLKVMVAEKAASLLDDLRCPEHDRAADVVIADDASGVTFGFCGSTMKDLAGDRLREKGHRSPIPLTRALRR